MHLEPAPYVEMPDSDLIHGAPPPIPGGVFFGEDGPPPIPPGVFHDGGAWWPPADAPIDAWRRPQPAGARTPAPLGHTNTADGVAVNRA